ncbi:MAG TPA: hypothetical protein VN962_19755 [Polyangia bacterium]|nr:hypothetical protein [Polyangia bacterium]
MTWKLSFAALALAVFGLGAPRSARAAIAAVDVEGHGGVTIGGGAGSPDDHVGGVGFQLGARLLIFEGYYDYTHFGGNAAVSRGIGGLRAGFGDGDVRLVLRLGGGVIKEEGGALTGDRFDLGSHIGVVGRIGAALETQVAPALLLGLGIDGETFILDGPSSPRDDGVYTGSDIFVNLHVMFELGI